MTYVVAEPCFDCKYTDCVLECPVDAFREGERMLYIDPHLCIDCDMCVPVCPVEAIFPEADVPEEWQDFIQLNSDMADSSAGEPPCPTITEKKDPLC